MPAYTGPVTEPEPRTSPRSHQFAALGLKPIHTIGREELQAKLGRGDHFRLLPLEGSML